MVSLVSDGLNCSSFAVLLNSDFDPTHSMPRKHGHVLDGADSDLDSNNGNESSESTLPTDPAIGATGLSLLDVCTKNVLSLSSSRRSTRKNYIASR